MTPPGRPAPDPDNVPEPSAGPRQARGRTGGKGGYLLGRVAKAMGQRFKALMREAGLGDIGPGEGRVVYLLWRGGSIRQGELAAEAGIDKSTLALTLARMERKGFVERRAAGDDARGVVVSLGPAMAARAPAFGSVSEAMNRIFYRGLSDPEIEDLESTLERILDNLE
ncbi:MAG: MarR family winged helix-turn-helix transcriptional regulator [Spirochaetes bacterium]|nr:MarR family winged helix-turn-helix transcriptional regulator [Spirochaetota bacterium]MBU1080984.1 MarR family winged helix-turn-helix transcriptional regulator [Spirochaetota bacterium]